MAHEIEGITPAIKMDENHSTGRVNERSYSSDAYEQRISPIFRFETLAYFETASSVQWMTDVTETETGKRWYLLAHVLIRVAGFN